MADGAQLPRPAAWAASVEEVDQELANAPAGEVVRVRLPLEGVPLAMVADGRGGATQRALRWPEDLRWLLAEHPEGTAMLLQLIDRREAHVASGEYARRVAMVQRVRRELMASDALHYLQHFTLPDAPMLEWVADESIKRVQTGAAEAWAYVSDPVFEFARGLQAAVERAGQKVSGIAKVLAWTGGGLVVVWAIGKATAPYRRAA